MSRYDLDHDPDELRSESVRKPQESSGDHEIFRLRGQGSSSGSAPSSHRNSILGMKPCTIPRKCAAQKMWTWNASPPLLDETGAPMKVQQELMRHASIQTTMNVYGQVPTNTKRQANSKVVQLVLKPAVSVGANEKGAAVAAP